MPYVLLIGGAFAAGQIVGYLILLVAFLLEAIVEVVATFLR